MAGEPIGYALATLAATFISIFFFGFTGTLFGGFLFDIGYSVDPIAIGGKAACIAAPITFVSGAWVSFCDYRSNSNNHRKNCTRNSMNALKKLKSLPAFSLAVIIATWLYRWNNGSFPNGWDVIPLLVGMIAGWILFRPEQAPSSFNAKWCKWLDHRYEYDKPDTAGGVDYKSEVYVCKRCGDFQNENEWGGPLPGMSHRKMFIVGLVVLGVIAACALPPLAKDAQTYRDVVAGQGCCGFVSESWIERPVTLAMVHWEKPYWSTSESRPERWLVADGMVSGEMKFWRILQREPLPTAQP
ncbi:hypothetical protein [Pseudomonas veronii]|uniref:hypothetical protein n=1 Tax=Pseudomonas veronii TaxID=76761 RepID=UPI000626773B|nr:hypothetical protein [Pseudomonas veronii]